MRPGSVFICLYNTPTELYLHIHKLYFYSFEEFISPQVHDSFYANKIGSGFYLDVDVVRS